MFSLFFPFDHLCCRHVIRKAIWNVTNFWIYKILHNIYLFSSSFLCLVGCLSFVGWKKYYVIFEISYFEIWDWDFVKLAMRNQGHLSGMKVLIGYCMLVSQVHSKIPNKCGAQIYVSVEFLEIFNNLGVWKN